MDTAGVCYVCLDELRPAPPSPCLCVNRYAHPACLAKMAAARTSAQCPVCLAPLRGLRVDTRTSWALSYEGRCFVGVGFAAVLTSAIALPLALADVGRFGHKGILYMLMMGTGAASVVCWMALLAIVALVRLKRVTLVYSDAQVVGVNWAPCAPCAPCAPQPDTTYV